MEKLITFALFLSALGLAAGGGALGEAEEADGMPLASLMEASANAALGLGLGVSLPNTFTICLKDKPMMCLAPSGDFNTDGTALIIADRLRTPGQRFRLQQGVLHLAVKEDRVIGAEHGAQLHIDSAGGGRVWLWKRQELSYDQQWNANEDPNAKHAQICMRAFPKACLYTNYPAENKVILANSDHANTFWVVRPTNPCADTPCDSHATCAGQDDGTAKCTCQPGYTLGSDNKCYEIDLCAKPETNPCDKHAECAKTGPAKVKCQCWKGWQGKGMKGECEETNACKASPPPCDKNSDCIPVGPGAYKCTCKPGFSPTSFTTCEETDLCSSGQANPCHQHATCTKTGPGKVKCACAPGYAGNGFSCAAVQPCEGNPCGDHAKCTPLGGSAGRKCECEAGYEQDKKSKDFKCVEGDACASKPCKGRNTYCKRVAPGPGVLKAYKCLCNPGHIPFFSGNCEKPGSKEALAAAAEEGNESARQEMLLQQRKAKEEENKRKQMEKEFRRKQKEREENIRALEGRIRELIHDRTEARRSERNKRIDVLTQRIDQLQTQQMEAAKVAALQMKVIGELSKEESSKAARIEAAMKHAASKAADVARRYAERLRDVTRDELSVIRAGGREAETQPVHKAAAAAAEDKEPRRPQQPPRYGDHISPRPLKLPTFKPNSGKPKGPAPPPPPAPIVPANAQSAAPPATETAAAPPAAPAAPAAASVPRFMQLPPVPPLPPLSRFAAVDVDVDMSAGAAVEADVPGMAAAAEEESDAAVEAAINGHSEEFDQSDEDLANELRKLHSEVDSHLDSVLSEADGAAAEVDTESSD